MAIGDLTFTVQKIASEGAQKSVKIIEYTVSGTDDNSKSASLQRTIGFKLKDGTEAGYVGFNDITEANAIAWIKSALTPTHIKDDYVDADGILQGTATGTDLWDEVERGIKDDIAAAIATVAREAETSALPWA